MQHDITKLICHCLLGRLWELTFTIKSCIETSVPPSPTLAWELLEDSLPACGSEAVTQGRWLAAPHRLGTCSRWSTLGQTSTVPRWAEQGQLGESSHDQQGWMLSPSTAVRRGAARHLLTERNVPKGHRGIRQNLWLHRRLWKTGGLSANVYMLFLHCSSPERTCSAKVQRTQERSLLTLFINSVSSGRSGFLKG